MSWFLLMYFSVGLLFGASMHALDEWVGSDEKYDKSSTREIVRIYVFSLFAWPVVLVMFVTFMIQEGGKK